MRTKPSRIYFASLGCDKNLVDTEKMMGLLAEAGYGFTDEEQEADVIVVNTCCFIGDAKEESIRTILELAEYKKTGRCRAMVVCGCLAERYREEIAAELPEIDALVGISGWDRIASVVEEALGRGTAGVVRSYAPNEGFCYHGFARILTTGGCYAYLKIAEGCSKRCTYCVIPYVRGDYRSLPMEELEEEAARLAGQGVRELVLVAQETTLYGVDLYGEKKLPELIRRLAAIPGLAWIRLMYCYPEEITPELVEVIRTEPKVCHYLDLPVQHASDRILQRMGRRTRNEAIRAVVADIRRKIPDIVLRTTLITGFPGETEEDFRELLAFVDEMEFERLGVFPYSREEQTAAAQMEGQVPEEVKQDRRDQVYALQQEISAAVEASCVGNVFRVMIEGKLADEDVYVGRTYMDAPGVDGYFFVSSGQELMSGTFVDACVTGSHEYDLIGEMIDEEYESSE